MMRSADERRRASTLEAEGGRAWHEGDRAGAERRFRESLSVFALLEDSSATGRILGSLAEIHIADGDFQAAEDLGRQAVEHMPGDVDALTVLGYAQWLGGSPADAQATFDQALHRDQSAARVLAGRGQVRTELGDYRKGLSDLDRALEAGVTAEDEIDVRSARALALAGLGRFAEARTEIETICQRAPDRPRTALRAVWIAVLEGRFSEVRDDLSRLSRLTEVASSPVAKSARRLLARQGEARP
jgi:tetratricopeptide (TPR) repeat protein